MGSRLRAAAADAAIRLSGTVNFGEALRSCVPTLLGDWPELVRKGSMGSDKAIFSVMVAWRRACDPGVGCLLPQSHSKRRLPAGLPSKAKNKYRASKGVRAGYLAEDVAILLFLSTNERQSRSGRWRTASLFLRVLAQKRLQRGDLLPASLEVVRDLLVEMRRARIELVRRGVLADEIGDLVHFRDPAIGLRRHDRELPFQPTQHLRLARGEFGEQRVSRSATRRRQHHDGAERLGALGDAGVRHLQCRSRGQRSLEHADVKPVLLKC